MEINKTKAVGVVFKTEDNELAIAKSLDECIYEFKFSCKAKHFQNKTKGL